MALESKIFYVNGKSNNGLNNYTYAIKVTQNSYNSSNDSSSITVSAYIICPDSPTASASSSSYIFTGYTHDALATINGDTWGINGLDCTCYYNKSTSNLPGALWSTTFTLNHDSTTHKLTVSVGGTFKRSSGYSTVTYLPKTLTIPTSNFTFSSPTTHTLTLKKDDGVNSFTGGGIYVHGTKAYTTCYAKSGYDLLKYQGTSYDGSGTGTWNISNTAMHTDEWNMYADRTITATSKRKTFTMSFNANGGTGSQSSGTKTYGVDYELPSCTFTHASSTSWRNVTFNIDSTRESCNTSELSAKVTTPYNFYTWNTQANGSGDNYKPKDKFKYQYAQTFYAMWSTGTPAVDSITLPAASKNDSVLKSNIVFEPNGGSCSTTSAQSTRTLSYTFKGWYTAYSGGQYAGKGGSKFTPSKDLQLYSQFTENDSGYSAITLPTPTRTGYSFGGWYTNSGLTGTKYNGGYSFTPSSSSHSFYAKWILNTRILTYNSNYGILPNGQTNQTQTLNYGVSTTLTFTTPSRRGYTFEGWSTSSQATVGDYKSGSSISITTDTTLYAVWKPLEFTIEYDLMGGSFSGDKIKVKYGESFNILTSKDVSKDKYDFVCWTTDPNKPIDTNDWTNQSGTWTFINGDKGIVGNTLKLYAVWEQSPFILSYKVYDRTIPANELLLKGEPVLGIKDILKRSSTKELLPYDKFDGWTVNGVLFTTNEALWTAIDTVAPKNESPRSCTLVARISSRNKIIYYNGSEFRKLVPITYDEGDRKFKKLKLITYKN